MACPDEAAIAAFFTPAGRACASLTLGNIGRGAHA